MLPLVDDVLSELQSSTTVCPALADHRIVDPTGGLLRLTAPLMPILTRSVATKFLLDQAVPERAPAQKHAANVGLLAFAVSVPLHPLASIARHRASQLAGARVDVLVRLGGAIRKILRASRANHQSACCRMSRELRASKETRTNPAPNIPSVLL